MYCRACECLLDILRTYKMGLQGTRIVRSPLVTQLVNGRLPPHKTDTRGGRIQHTRKNCWCWHDSRTLLTTHCDGMDRVSTRASARTEAFPLGKVLAINDWRTAPDAAATWWSATWLAANACAAPWATSRACSKGLMLGVPSWVSSLPRSDSWLRHGLLFNAALPPCRWGQVTPCVAMSPLPEEHRCGTPLLREDPSPTLNWYSTLVLSIACSKIGKSLFDLSSLSRFTWCIPWDIRHLAALTTSVIAQDFHVETHHLVDRVVRHRQSLVMLHCLCLAHSRRQWRHWIFTMLSRPLLIARMQMVHASSLANVMPHPLCFASRLATFQSKEVFGTANKVCQSLLWPFAGANPLGQPTEQPAKGGHLCWHWYGSAVFFFNLVDQPSIIPIAVAMPKLQTRVPLSGCIVYVLQFPPLHMPVAQTSEAQLPECDISTWRYFLCPRVVLHSGTRSGFLLFTVIPANFKPSIAPRRRSLAERGATSLTRSWSGTMLSHPISHGKTGTSSSFALSYCSPGLTCTKGSQ